METWLQILIAFFIGLLLGLILVWRRSRKRQLVRSKFLLKSTRGKLQKLDVGSIHYKQFGKGPHLLLIHGIGASIFCWRDIVGALSEHFRITAIDLMGFGQSSRPKGNHYDLDHQAANIINFLDAQGIRQCRVVGHSMGGAISLWLAKKYPQRFFEVACLAPATNPKLAPLKVEGLAWTSNLVQKALNESTMKLIIGRVYARKENITKEVVRNYLAPFSQYPETIKTFIQATKLIQDPRLPQELYDLTVPVLILWGAKDKMVGRKYIDELNKILPHSTKHIHPKAGHHIMEDEPEWVIAHLEDFFLSNET